jgi:hypothetical protein
LKSYLNDICVKTEAEKMKYFGNFPHQNCLKKKKKTLKGDISEIKGGIGYCRSMEMVKLFLRE